MLAVLANCRQFQTLAHLLREMGTFNLLSMEAFQIALLSFASSNQISRCLWLFRLMNHFGFHADLHTFNSFLDKLAAQKLGKQAHKLFDKMSAHYTPDIQTYTALLSGWCKLKNLVEAARIWNQMLDRGFKPDIVAYNIMLEGLIHGQRRPEAIKLFHLMRAKGPTPNALTYTIIIHALCKGGKMDMAFRFFLEMQAAGCEPNMATYTCLLTGFGKAGNMDQVHSLIAEMEQMGPAPDLHTYNALIKLFTIRAMPKEAGQAYKNMVGRGFEPTVHTYNMIMKSYFSESHEMGSQVWEEMAKKGICPNANSYSVYIAGHIRHGRVGEAERYLLEMVNKGMKLPQLDYNKFVADFSRMGEPNKLEEFIQKLRSDGKFDAANWLNHRAERVRVGKGPNQSTRP